MSTITFDTDASDYLIPDTLQYTTPNPDISAEVESLRLWFTNFTNNTMAVSELDGGLNYAFQTLTPTNQRLIKLIHFDSSGTIEFSEDDVSRVKWNQGMNDPLVTMIHKQPSQPNTFILTCQRGEPTTGSARTPVVIANITETESDFSLNWLNTYGFSSDIAAKAHGAPSIVSPDGSFTYITIPSSAPEARIIKVNNSNGSIEYDIISSISYSTFYYQYMTMDDTGSYLYILSSVLSGTIVDKSVYLLKVDTTTGNVIDDLLLKDYTPNSIAITGNILYENDTLKIVYPEAYDGVISNDILLFEVNPTDMTIDLSKTFDISSFYNPLVVSGSTSSVSFGNGYTFVVYPDLNNTSPATVKFHRLTIIDPSNEIVQTVNISDGGYQQEIPSTTLYRYDTLYDESNNDLYVTFVTSQPLVNPPPSEVFLTKLHFEITTDGGGDNGNGGTTIRVVSQKICKPKSFGKVPASFLIRQSRALTTYGNQCASRNRSMSNMVTIDSELGDKFKCKQCK